MLSRSYERFAGLTAVAAGICGLLYAVSFIVFQDATQSALFLTLSGLLVMPVFIVLFFRLQQSDTAFALWALVMGVTGAIGSAIHGGYDLANRINPPAASAGSGIASLPSQIDPRGLLTFGFVAIGVFVFSCLLVGSGRFPAALGYLGILSAILLAALYLGRLVVLDPTSPILVAPALLSGFVVGPLWYLWLGAVFWQHAGSLIITYRGAERRLGDRRQPESGSQYDAADRRLGERREARTG